MEQSMTNKKKNPYYMLWHTKEGFYIENDTICEDISVNSLQGYNPLYAVEYGKTKNRRRQQGPYLDFINIHYDSDGDKVTEDILNFVFKHGLLYDDIADDRRLKEYSTEGVHVLDEKPFYAYQMSIPEFIGEGKRFKYIVELYSCLCTIGYDDEKDIELSNEDSLIYMLQQFLRKYPKEKTPIGSAVSSIGLDLIKDELQQHGNINVESIRKNIMIVIRSTIKPYIENIHFQVLPDSDIDIPQLKGNLLEAMYFRFYIDMLLKVPIKRCRAIECNNIFAVYSDKRQQRRKYCCEACRKRHHKQIQSRTNRFG